MTDIGGANQPFSVYLLVALYWSAMKVYKAWNGTLDKYGKGLYVFVVAENDEQALGMAKEAFSSRRSTTRSNSEVFIRIHAIIDDVSRPGTSGVWELPGEPYP